MDRDALLDRALALADEGDWPRMAELLSEHLADFEDDPAVHCWLGVAERELGMEGVAYERFKRVLALDPEDPYVLATAGGAIAAFDDPEAEQALRNAALTAPDIPLTRLMYGAYLAREGFHEDGLKELEAARELSPEDPQIRYELGAARALAGDMDGAADTLGDAVRLDREDGWARVVFGLVLLEAGQPEEASGELVEGARLREDDLEAQLLAALAAGAIGRDDLAYEMLERARMRVVEGDLVLVTSVEDRLDEGHESAQATLAEDFAPDALRARLQERP